MEKEQLKRIEDLNSERAYLIHSLKESNELNSKLLMENQQLKAEGDELVEKKEMFISHYCETHDKLLIAVKALESLREPHHDEFITNILNIIKTK